MLAKILYTGLDPSRFKSVVHHVPFITVQPRPFQEIRSQFQCLGDTPDILLTSRSAVPLFLHYAQQVQADYWDKRFFAVGQATAALLFETGIKNILIAKQECCEGVCELFQQHPPEGLFYPHAALSRKVISTYLSQNNKRYIDVILYTTHPRMPHPLPDLHQYAQVILTSPSTVGAFFACYPNLPQHVRLTPIGPITKQALMKALQDRGQVDQIYCS